MAESSDSKTTNKSITYKVVKATYVKETHSTSSQYVTFDPAKIKKLKIPCDDQSILKVGSTVYCDQLYNDKWARLFVFDGSKKNTDPASHVKLGWVRIETSEYKYLEKVEENAFPKINTTSSKTKDAVQDAKKVEKEKKRSTLGVNTATNAVTNDTKNTNSTSDKYKKKDIYKIQREGIDSNLVLYNRIDKDKAMKSALGLGEDDNGNWIGLVKAIENNGLTLGYKDAKNKYFNKFPRIQVIDPHFTTLNGTKEYLFFVRPDLNLIKNADSNNGAGLRGNLVKVLQSSAFFNDLVQNHPSVVKELQYSYDRKPFSNLLSATVCNNLDLPNIDAEVMDGPANIYGTAISYRQSGYKSDEDHSFSLEFRETKNFDIYYFFKAYEEYERRKILGLTEPKYAAYIIHKILYDQMAIYKFIIGDDGYTINHYSLLTGVKPMSVPRNAFSEPSSSSTLKYSIDFKAEFVDDMNPSILRDFNTLMQIQASRSNGKFNISNEYLLPLFDARNMQVDGSWAQAAQVYQTTINGQQKFILNWFGKK